MGVGLELVEALGREDNVKVVELLARLDGGTVNEADADGYTPLHMGCARNYVGAVATVLAIPGVNLNARANDGTTPLMMAAAAGSCESMRMVLDNHAVEVNARDNDGCTAIMWAAASCEVEALRILVDHPHVDLDLIANDGDGVEEYVGVESGSSTEKFKCFDIIQEGRRERKKKSQEQGLDFSEAGKSAEEVRADVIRQIDELSLNIEEKENKIKADLEIKNEKMKVLTETQNSEREAFATKSNQEKIKYEEEKCQLQQKLAALEQSWKDKSDKNRRTVDEMNRKHQNEKKLLEDKFKKEAENDRQLLASLKETTDELARDLRKLDLEPANDATPANILEKTLFTAGRSYNYLYYKVTALRKRKKKSPERGLASNAKDDSELGASGEEWSLGLEKTVEELVKQELVKQFSASAGPQIYIGNMNVSIVQNLVIQNLTAKLGVTDEREASELLKLLGTQEDAKQCEQKLTRLTQSQVDFGLLKISTITRSTCLVDYASSNGNFWHGTGFLLTVDNFPGLIMLSAGHNFEDNGAILRDFKNFSFFFNNMSGQRNTKSNLLGALGAGGEDKECIMLNLQTLMEKYRPTLVITYKKMRLIQRGDLVISRSDLTGDDALFDYFALVFDDAGIRATLEEKGLRFLQCGSSAELSPNTGDPLLVFGHPGVNECNCQKKKCSCAHPLRLSYGQETGSSTHRIQYDMDTLRGNSGSPITGKHCKVKGIHMSAADNKTQNFNMAQTVESVLQDLRKVNALP